MRQLSSLGRALFLCSAALMMNYWSSAIVLAQSAGNFTTLSTSGAATMGGDVLACSGRPWLDVRCPMKLFAPPQPSLGETAGGNLGAASYWVRITYVNAAGETTGSTEASRAVSANDLLTIASPAAIPGATGWNAYVGMASGSETKQNASPIALGTGWIESAAGLVAGAGLPAADTANVAGAQGDDAADDTAAIALALRTAAANGWPLYFSAGIYRVTQGLTLDYTGTAGSGFRLISVGATIDGAAVTGAPVLTVECSGGSVGSPKACFYFRQSGTLFVKANENGYAFEFGKTDFSDRHNSVRLDHLVVSNASTAGGAGGCQFNAVHDGAIDAVCDSGGGGAGIALEGVQSSRIMGAGAAAGSGGRALVLENGGNVSNTIEGMDLEGAPTCLSITSAASGENSFLSPYFNCNTAVNATAGGHNLLVNPLFGALVLNRGPQSAGISVSYTGNRQPWQFPAAASFTAAAIDDGTVLSSENAPGASVTVALPAPSSVNPGWRMGFATGNGKGMTVDAASGSIVSGGVATSSLVLGPGNYEFVELECDGSNFRVTAATRATRLYNGFEPSPAPSRWLYPYASGYAAALLDDGSVFSSANTALTSSAPNLSQTSGGALTAATYYVKATYLNANGETIGSAEASLAVSANNLLVVSVPVNAYATGWNIYAATTSGSETKQNASPIAIGANWTEPTSGLVSGAAPPAQNTTGGLTVTLPQTASLPNGWSIGVATDAANPVSVRVNGTGGGHILFPGSGTAMTSVKLAQTSGGAYEFASVQYDGDGNFRLVGATPATAMALGETGAASVSRWLFPAVSAYAAALTDNGIAISSANSPLSYLTVTLPPTTALTMGWKIAIASDGGKAAAVQVNGSNGGHILFPGAGSGVSSFSLAGNNFEYATLQFDGSNFRVVAASPQSLQQNGVLGPAGISRWSFPTGASYGATAADNGNAVSSGSTAAGLTVTLPQRTTLPAGWTMGFASDNGEPLTVGTYAGDNHILEPARGGVTVSSVTLPAGQNHEFLALQFDGTDFRVMEASPQTVNVMGGLVTAGSPADNAACSTGQIEFDSNYLYLCTAPNTWKRAAWSSY